MELNASQKELVLKIAELLVGQEECHSKAEFWVEKAAKQLPGNPAVFDLKVTLAFLLYDASCERLRTPLDPVGSSAPLCRSAC